MDEIDHQFFSDIGYQAANALCGVGLNTREKVLAAFAPDDGGCVRRHTPNFGKTSEARVREVLGEDLLKERRDRDAWSKAPRFKGAFVFRAEPEDAAEQPPQEIESATAFVADQTSKMFAANRQTLEESIAPRLRELCDRLVVVTEQDLCLLCDITASIAEDWRKRQQGPSFALVGNRVLYPRAAVVAFIKKNAHERRTIASEAFQGVTSAAQPASVPPAETTEEGRGVASAPYPPLQTLTRLTVPTAQAAYYLNRKPQTLRYWSCDGKGPIKPVRLNGRMEWPVPEIKRVLSIP